MSIEESGNFLLNVSLYQHGYPMLGFAAGIMISYFLKLNLPPLPSELLCFTCGIGGLLIAAIFPRHGMLKIVKQSKAWFEITG